MHVMHPTRHFQSGSTMMGDLLQGHGANYALRAAKVRPESGLGQSASLASSDGVVCHVLSLIAGGTFESHSNPKLQYS